MADYDRLRTPFLNMSFTPDVPSNALGPNEYNSGSNVEADVRGIKKIGGEEEISILDLAKLVITETKSKSKIKFVPYSLAYPVGFEDSMRRNPDTSKLRKFTGWAPKYSLKAIISDVASSMKA